VSSTVTVTGVDQTPVLGGGGNVTVYAAGGTAAAIDAGLTVADADNLNLAGATVSIGTGLRAGDVLNFTNQNGIIGSYNAATGVLTLSGTATIANYQAALESVTYSSTSSNPSNSGADTSRTVSWNVTDGTLSSNTISTTVNTDDAVTLTTGKDTVTLGGIEILAPVKTLSTGDVITPGTGYNYIQLVGGGAFSLATPTTLSNVQVVNAQEATGSALQSITLRSGLNVTVNVASGGAGTGITITGANDASTINLGTGTDTVTLGSANETINGGGADYILATGTTIGATINGGGGTSYIAVSGGGTVVMGSNITNIVKVTMAAASTQYQFTANAIKNLVIYGSGGNDIITVGDASQTVRTGNGNVTVVATAATAGITVVTGTGHDVLQITGGGTAALNTAQTAITVQLTQATNLTLDAKTGMTVLGSGLGDTITAKQTSQTLTGNGGNANLIGYVGGGDIFRDTTAHFSGETVTNFAATGNQLDLTDLNFAAASLQYTQGATSGTLALTDGTHSASIALFGQFVAAGFHLAADSGSGTLVTYSPPTNNPAIAASNS
jgi:hypothetical protein